MHYLLGDKLDAKRLLREGIATEIPEDDQVGAPACALAAQVAGYPPSDVRRIKTALRAASAGMNPRD